MDRDGVNESKRAVQHGRDPTVNDVRGEFVSIINYNHAECKWAVTNGVNNEVKQVGILNGLDKVNNHSYHVMSDGLLFCPCILFISREAAYDRIVMPSFGAESPNCTFPLNLEHSPWEEWESGTVLIIVFGCLREKRTKRN